ncbi:hypothetical protein QF044_002446 [Chryseobacterium sp. W4I1]|nr:hypothetical protein [Chryseobacterium sp. W4I1]
MWKTEIMRMGDGIRKLEVTSVLKTTIPFSNSRKDLVNTDILFNHN